MIFTINHIYYDTAEHIRSADSDSSEAGIGRAAKLTSISGFHPWSGHQSWTFIFANL